jgi:tRNA(adenine34) deaminase
MFPDERGFGIHVLFIIGMNLLEEPGVLRLAHELEESAPRDGLGFFAEFEEAVRIPFGDPPKLRAETAEELLDAEIPFKNKIGADFLKVADHDFLIIVKNVLKSLTFYRPTLPKLYLLCYNQHMNDEYYMRLALKEAERAFEKEEVPVGCVIVRGGQIIAKAHNQIELLKDPTAHAEMLALTQASSALPDERGRLAKATVYVTLEPCAMCAGALVLARVERLVFGANDPKAGACGTLFNIVESTNLNHRIQVMRGLLEAESRSLLQLFFQNLRKENR